jgi:GT2 family glycosyltransferase
MNEKCGLAVITHRRPDYLSRCLDSLEKNGWGGATERIVVADEEYNESYAGLASKYPNVVFFYAKNQGVAVAKNRAFRRLLEKGCDHFFIMEDDQVMLHPATCAQYIDYAAKHGLHHLNFAHHGNQRRLNWFIELEGVHCYPDCVGAFSYYTREVLDKVGLLDENFRNAWEHVEHTMRIAEAGYTTPFWYFADHPNSRALVQEQPLALESGTIRLDPLWHQYMNRGMQYWIEKHGRFLPPRPDYHGIKGVQVVYRE